MADVIHSIGRFREELKVGDVFWHMRSLYRAPDRIEGPCTILSIFKDIRFQILMVRYSRARGEEEVIQEHSMGDLTNEHHGVFLNFADACVYLEERKAAFVADPSWMAKVVESREDIRSEIAMLERLF